MTALSETFGWTGFDGIRSSLINDCIVRLEDCMLYIQYGTCGAILKTLKEEFIFSFSADFQVLFKREVYLICHCF
jgi:hypothetical protein